MKIRAALLMKVALQHLYHAKIMPKRIDRASQLAPGVLNAFVGPKTSGIVDDGENLPVDRRIVSQKRDALVGKLYKVFLYRQGDRLADRQRIKSESGQGF